MSSQPDAAVHPAADDADVSPTEEFTEACKEALALFVQTTESELPKRHALGAIAQRMKMLSATYGKHAVERLAKVLGQDKSTLYKAIKVVDVFNDDDVAKIVERNRRPDVRPFSWNHFVLCASLPVEAKALRDRSLEHGWSITELKSEVSKAGKRTGVSTAPTVNRDIQRVAKLLEKVVEVANDAARKPVRSVPDDQQDSLAALIATAIQEAEAVGELLTKIGQRFTASHFNTDRKGLARTKGAVVSGGTARRNRLIRAKGQRTSARAS
jgi:hypothetical protein